MRKTQPSNVNMSSYKKLKEKKDSSSSVIGFKGKDRNNKGDRLNKKEEIKNKDSANNMNRE